MKGKKMLSIGLVLTMIMSTAVCAGAAEAAGAEAPNEISPQDISVRWEDSRVYTDLSLGRYTEICTYEVKGYEDVPFISADDYLDILFEGRETVSKEDGVMKIVYNGAGAVIDPAADTVYFENPARFRSVHEAGGGVVEDEEFNVITFSKENESFQEEPEPATISLSEYHMPVITYEDTILMPFLALQNTFGSVMQSNKLAYNGKDYFNAFEAEYFVLEAEDDAVKDSPYIKAIYSGPFSELEETSQAYADYGYYSVCLLLDLTYGHKEEKNITTFDEYFTRMNAKEAMRSVDPSSAMTTEFLLFSYLFDSGHDSMMSSSNVFDVKGSTDDAMDIGSVDENSVEAFLGVLMEKGIKLPEVVPLLAWTTFMERSRPEGYGDERLDFAGDTAVIYFNAFKDNSTERDPSYYLDPINEEDKEESTFAFFYDCFEEIKKHDEVKNVVINLSDNGGGYASALVSVLGFLSPDGEVKITSQDLMGGNYREECYHVDTNLDGAADDQDGFGGQYEFYIMCSGSSYSCGNALPYFAQQDGLAKIIGTKPGGGDCVVASFVDAYGRCAVYSGMLKLGKMKDGEFVSDEKATEPDLNMMPTLWDIGNVPWFDAEGIADAVHQYQDGTEVIIYNDKSEDEKMEDFLETFREVFGKNKKS